LSPKTHAWSRQPLFPGTGDLLGLFNFPEIDLAVYLRNSHTRSSVATILLAKKLNKPLGLPPKQKGTARGANDQSVQTRATEND